MRIGWIVIVRTFLFVAVCFSVARARAAEGLAVDEALRQRVETLVGKSLVFGVALGVIDGDNTHTVYAGHSSFGGPKPGERTVFEIGSVTKTFTGLLLADAVVRSQVKLDQPVAELLGPRAVLPNFQQHPIRLIDLATQTSGLPRMPTNIGWLINPLNPYASYSVEDLDEFLASYKLKREPGKEFAYSNLGMGLLGHALAKHSGKTY